MIAYHRRLPSPEAFAATLRVRACGDVVMRVELPRSPNDPAWLSDVEFREVGPDLTNVFNVGAPPWGVLIAQDRVPYMQVYAFYSDVSDGRAREKWVAAPNKFAALCAARQAWPLEKADTHVVSLTRNGYWTHMNEIKSGIDLVVLP